MIGEDTKQGIATLVCPPTDNGNDSLKRTPSVKAYNSKT